MHFILGQSPDRDQMVILQEVRFIVDGVGSGWGSLSSSLRISLFSEKQTGLPYASCLELSALHVWAKLRAQSYLGLALGPPSRSPGCMPFTPPLPSPSPHPSWLCHPMPFLSPPWSQPCDSAGAEAFLSAGALSWPAGRCGPPRSRLC